jgi:hypothetical protein
MLLDTLVEELNSLADAERAAFERSPPGPQQSVQGDNSKDAQDQLDAAASSISNVAAELSALCEPDS